ncbi:transmembrane protein 59-like [Actinia tenebrosa]|uniref:Transmembrane protein 59-like n=1 Tax=Actinia tenebrosa TaxID=6105 RepID=A0A6P8IIS1_ACTTE|nr:transmembrane protein 59-like [Actinia tenebrosa]
MATVNMKNCALSLLLFIAVLSSISLGEQPKSITEECKKRCERSYPPHTYPKPETHEACLRGCRLSAIGQLSSPDRNKENASKICIAGCKESYPDGDRLYACKVGCNSQDIIPTPEAMYKEHKDGMMAMHGYMSLRPIMVAQQYCHGLIRKVTYFVSISSTYYSSTNSAGQTVVVKIDSPPQLLTHVSQRLTSKDDTQINVQKRDKDDKGYSWKIVHKSRAWLHCVSRRSGLPFWLLSITLFMGFAFMLWVCCSSFSLDQNQEKEKQLRQDDIFLLEDDDEFLLKKQPITKSEEAGPLPVKVNISASII